MRSSRAVVVYETKRATESSLGDSVRKVRAGNVASPEFALDLAEFFAELDG